MTHYIIYYTQDDLNSVLPDPKILNPDPWNPTITLYLIHRDQILEVSSSSSNKITQGRNEEGPINNKYAFKDL